jgi:hypothetical protein
VAGGSRDDGGAARDLDPATRKDEKLRVGADDEFAVGKERYRVVQIVSEQGNDFAYLEVVPID